MRSWALMKSSGILINASRGTVVDIDALADALRTGHTGGAVVDVFPVEPKGATEPFGSPLRGIDNVILTPHVGGSTLEAQDNIGVEVAAKLVRYGGPRVTLVERVPAQLGRGVAYSAEQASQLLNVRAAADRAGAAPP